MDKVRISRVLDQGIAYKLLDQAQKEELLKKSDVEVERYVADLRVFLCKVADLVAKPYRCRKIEDQIFINKNVEKCCIKFGEDCRKKGKDCEFRQLLGSEEQIEIEDCFGMATVYVATDETCSAQCGERTACVAELVLRERLLVEKAHKKIHAPVVEKIGKAVIPIVDNTKEELLPISIAEAIQVVDLQEVDPVQHVKDVFECVVEIPTTGVAVVTEVVKENLIESDTTKVIPLITMVGIPQDTNENSVSLNAIFKAGSTCAFVLQELQKDYCDLKELAKIVQEKFGGGKGSVSDLAYWGEKFGRIEKKDGKVKLMQW